MNYYKLHKFLFMPSVYLHVLTHTHTHTHTHTYIYSEQMRKNNCLNKKYLMNQKVLKCWTAEQYEIARN